MFATLEEFLHRFRRKFDRSEWAIRNLHLPVSEGTAEEPGLLLIQIDGLSRQEMERALASGRMPFLARLRDRSKYAVHSFYPGVPSTTPAVQAELYYGVKTAVPAFCFLDRATGEVGSMFEPERAANYEKEFAMQGDPLLKGGSSWSNIYSGGAGEEDSHFCVSRLGLGDVLRGGHFAARIGFAALQIPALLRLIGLVVLELGIGLLDILRGLWQGEPILLELGMVLSRMCVGVGVRELVRVGGKLDVARGLPIVHLNFVGYDEMAHRRGPDSWFARWALPGIDRAIADLYRKAHQSRRRDYQVWIFSDHGQERTRSFETECEEGFEGLVESCLSPGIVRRSRDRQAPPRRPISRRGYEREVRKRGARKPRETTFSLAAMGPVAHVYFSGLVEPEEKEILARRLIEQGKIPAVLHLNADGTMTWHDARGTARTEAEVMERLSAYPEALRPILVKDILALCRNENAGDLVLLGYCGVGECWTFADEHGSHAGIGLRELRGFLLTPPATRLPAGSADFVRPSGLRAAIFHLLDREPFDAPPARVPHKTRLRIMTYNVHGCRGMDGRVSPRRIARIITQQDPDIVALQELDHGRARSRGEDQATLIADLLGYHLIFCPTVISGTERYGHAVLSRLPIEAIKVAELPSNARGVWPERRGALWSRVKLHDLSIDVVTTHFGLSARERHSQMSALLGPEWVGPMLASEAVILCGDFNFRPGGASHRLAAAKLRDVVGTRRLNTFSSAGPFARLDYIFTSRHFEPENVSVVSNQLTRVSSDHLPLIADLVIS